ncbi:MAG: inositol monophosphatase family protein [Dysosmobacter sp.]|jgi:myo-inositol-1(or 4)-monophosphatase|uniref:inositol monophosphatase family protein n=1 Tax=Dysosmobacter sp. TaxID=2591382 RepID=UPI003D8A06F6
MRVLTDVLAEQAEEAVREAGALLTDPAAVQTILSKSPTDFVTNVDLAVQSLLRDRLFQLAPAVQFLGEEGDHTAIDPGRPFWILDPVDGTTNLIHRFQHSAVSLALAEDGQVTFGVVYHPYTQECFTARRGGGVFQNGRPIRVSGTTRLAESLLSAGTVPGRRELADEAFRQMRALYDRCQDVRRTGCASLDLCYVACGRLDGYVELSLQPWDYAAGALVVEEAGGQITTPNGSPLSLTEGGAVLASNQILHAALMDALNG